MDCIYTGSGKGSGKKLKYNSESELYWRSFHSFRLHNPYKLLSCTVTMRVRHVPKIIEREEENCYLLINRRTGQRLVLNEGSFFVWKLCEDSTVDDIIKKVVEKFELDEKEAEEKIKDVIESFYQKGLIEKEE